MQTRRKLTLGLLLIRRNECSLLNVIWQQKAVEPSHYLVKYQGISLLKGNFDLEIKTETYTYLKHKLQMNIYMKQFLP